MKRINSRGFLLAESLVVSTFVLTVLILIYIQFNNLVINYKNSYNYNSVESIYSLGSIGDYLENNITSGITIPASQYVTIYGPDTSGNLSCNSNIGLTNTAFCESLVKQAGIKYLIYTSSDVSGIQNYINNNSYDKDKNLNQSFRNFITKVSTQKIQNKGRLFAEFTDGTFSTIAINVFSKQSTQLVVGTVKGGTISGLPSTITLSKDITFTATPSTDFTYKGALLICNDNTKYNIDSSSTTFKINDNSCTSATLYPIWRKNDYVQMQVDQSAAKIHWNGNLFDGCAMTISYSATRYYLNFSHGACASRGQVSTVSPIAVDDYESMKTIVWCSPSSTVMQGLISTPSTWLHDSSTIHEDKVITGASDSPETMVLDISSAKGSYYLAVQKLLTSGQSGYCYVNGVTLVGKTYSKYSPQ